LYIVITGLGFARVIVGQDARIDGIVVIPDLGRLVSCLAKKDTHIFVCVNERYFIVQNAMGTCISTGIHTHPAWATRRSLNKALFKGGTLCNEGIEIWGFDNGMTDTTQAIGTKLVGEDKENVSRHDGFSFEKTQFGPLIGRYNDAQRRAFVFEKV
jgi:hypothetical protein